MTPDEAAAYLASHPNFARRVEETGRRLAEEYASTLAVGEVGGPDGEPPAR